MTPEKALAILEGKIAHREHLPESNLDENEKRITPTVRKMQLKNMEIMDDTADLPPERNYDFIKVLAAVIILCGLTVGYLWRMDVVSKSFYKNGFNDGAASISVNLTSAQKDISDKLLQLDQLQQEMAKTRQNLDLVTRQKDQLAQSLKQTQDSVPTKIGAVERLLEGKIRNLKLDSEQKISGLSNALASSQKDNSDKDKQLGALQKALAVAQQQRDQALQAIAEKERLLAAIQKDLNTKAQQVNNKPPS